MAKDISPLIPDLGPLHLSSLFQRRTESKELLSDSYVKFEDYDNLSVLSFDSLNNHQLPDLITVPQNYEAKKRWQQSYMYDADFLFFLLF